LISFLHLILISSFFFILRFHSIKTNQNTSQIIHIIKDETSKSSSTANELGLANVGGVFVVLMGGMGIACVIAVCEFVWKSRKVAVEEKVRNLL
jgi:hypothetical protein